MEDGFDRPAAPAAWERAWLARDPAFDGVFFAGVRTTGVYCRCVCPVRLPRRRNVEFLPSAASAERAGYRPCLRCRPEAAPHSPAWRGTRAIVDRAARLIAEERALDAPGATVDALAARVGVGARHLARLFRRHLGASPVEFARTARVQRAKRLLDATDLPMAEVAARAGFGSLRRFNAVFAEVYRTPPTAIRRRGPTAAPRRSAPPSAGPCAAEPVFAGPALASGRGTPRATDRGDSAYALTRGSSSRRVV